jgi:outer membrane protein assembly factor BamB
MDRVDQEKDILTCAKLADGDVKWKFEHAVPGRITHPGSRSVPTVREDAVYGSGGFGHVYCVDRKTGEKRWVLDMAEIFDSQVPRFGYAVHPLIHGDLCIVAPIGRAVGVAAVDRKTGETVWKAPSVGESQSSPILVKLMGREIVTMPGSRDGSLVLSGLDPKDGKVLFEYTEEIGRGIFNAIPNPSRAAMERERGC